MSDSYEQAKNAFQRIVPRQSKTYKALRKVVAPIIRRLNKDAEYRRWIRDIEPRIFLPAAKYEYEPLISIVIPAYNTPDRYLDPLLDSVVNQTYQNWELCLVQGGSPSKERATAIRAAAALDPRIRIIEVEENGGISGNTNVGIAAAKGEYIAFCDHDDIISTHALNEVVQRLQERRYDLIYSDEDYLTDDGKRRFSPFFKPDWSPDLFRHVNYITHLTVVKASLARKLGGIRKEFEGAQDFDFLLRLSELNPAVCHVPKILYHWRTAVGSTARDLGEKSYAHEAGKAAIKEHLERTGVKADLLSAGRATNHRVRYHAEPAKVAVLFPALQSTAGEISAMAKLVAAATKYKHPVEYLAATYAPVKLNSPLRNVVVPVGLPISEIFQKLRESTDADTLVFTHGQIAPLNDDWLTELVGVSQQAGVGLVTTYLFQTNGAVDKTGAVLELNSGVGYPFRGLSSNVATYIGHTDWPRNFLNVPGDCFAVSARVFDEIGGLKGNPFEPFYGALSSRAYSKGLRNVFWPEARVVNYGCFPALDPYFNPNIASSSEHIHLNTQIVFDKEAK